MAVRDDRSDVKQTILLTINNLSNIIWVIALIKMRNFK